jgi:hypothetical protein
VRTFFALCALTLSCASPALAHRASDSYLALAPATDAALQGHWDVALSDLVYALDLSDAAGALSWGALRTHEAECGQLLKARLHFDTLFGACRIEVEALSLIDLSDGRYVRLPFRVRCPESPSVRVSSSLLLDVDRDHRSLLRFGAGEVATTEVLSLQSPARELSLKPQSAVRSAWPNVVQQVRRGVVHIFEGIDHIAFLLVLLLPVLFRSRAEQTPQPLPALLWAVAKLVTSFTLAHSLTLSLSALGLVRTSADVIEPAIAASVALAALSSLLPGVLPEGSVLAFTLGLLHGFGFASALSDAGLSGAALVHALLGFNLGVELGQLAIVGIFVPLSLILLRRSILREPLRVVSSVGVLLLALFWIFERLQTG